MQGVGRYTGARRRTANLPVEYPRSNIAAPGHDPQTPELQGKIQPRDYLTIVKFLVYEENQ